MQINMYKDRMQKAYLFGAPVLYSEQLIPREDVPKGWYCYDLCGTAEDPHQPYKLVDQAERNHAGSVLSYLPLKNGRSKSRLVKNEFQLTAVSATLSKFCSDEKIRCPETPIRHLLRPASPEEAGLFYAQMPERDRKGAPAGAQRSGSGGERRKERSGVKFSPSGGNETGGVSSDEGGSCCQNYGFTLETERYIYRLRCNPMEGDYQAYLSCFDKQAQQMGLTEKGRQALQNAADPNRPHTYSWYVIEDINTPLLQAVHELPLEEALRLYRGLDCGDKRLGVIKDGVSSVDLIIRLDGREWLPQDYLREDAFKDDPVAVDAAARLRQVLEENPAVGRITFADGERWNYTDSEKYLQAIREELPLQATTGFRCETLTDDPTVRKAVDDMLHDLYGEENPRQIEDYGGTGMTMGGMCFG